MKILALEHELPNVKADLFKQFAMDEARRVWELTQAGITLDILLNYDYNVCCGW